MNPQEDNESSEDCFDRMLPIKSGCKEFPSIVGVREFHSYIRHLMLATVVKTLFRQLSIGNLQVLASCSQGTMKLHARTKI
jgi:hypothetical protein